MDTNDFFHDAINDYRMQLTRFYSPFFDNKTELDSFISIAFNYDKEFDNGRFMIQQVQRFVSLANDIDQLRPGRDSLRILFIKVCMESLCKLSDQEKTRKFYAYFEKCFSAEGKQYILSNFIFSHLNVPEDLSEDDELKFDNHSDYSLTCGDFLNVIKAVRDMVVHDGDYWSMQFFAHDDDSIWFTCLETDEKVISCQEAKKGTKLAYEFQTTLQYDRFIHYFVEACINFIISFAKKDALLEV